MLDEIALKPVHKDKEDLIKIRFNLNQPNRKRWGAVRLVNVRIHL